MKRSLTSAAGLALAAGLAFGAAPAEAAVSSYTAGPFSTLNSCQSTRTSYVKQGGFNYVGGCYKNTNNRYYFNYR